jgi:allantoinase
VTIHAIRSERVVFQDEVRPAIIHVRDGRIAAHGRHDDPPAGIPILDVGALVVLPGLVDTHVHINEPGRTDWEGFVHATRSAAAGGFTTIVDMPLNSIPATTTVAGLEAKRAAARGRCHVDVGFWGGVVPGNADDLAPLAEAGVLGFKCFLSPPGVDEFEHVAESDLRLSMPILAALGLPLLVHAELPSALRNPMEKRGGETPNRRAYSTWLRSRPPESEHAAVALLIELARATRARVHVVHLAAADALPLLLAARRDGVALTVETCPHYLTFAAADIADGATAFKCAPPIRDREHREGLWAGLTRGDVDFVATDHSPAPPALKHLDDGDFVSAWGGIASLQVASAVMWTGMHVRNVPMQRMAAWLAQRPSRLAGLHWKGTLAPGSDADLAIWDPDATTTVDARALYHRHPVTPYDGATLRGRVVKTILRGEIVFDEGVCVGDAKGQLLSRPV